MFNIVKRDLNDAKSASKHLSLDWQFGILYNSVLKLATILLRSENLRSGSVAHHKTTIECIPFILGEKSIASARYLDTCRVKRNKVEYDMVGLVSKDDVEELLEFARSFFEEIEGWMLANHTDLM